MKPSRFTTLLTGAVASAALATTLTGAAAPSADRPHRPDAAVRTLTVATFNIHHAADRFDVLDIERVAGDIADFEADVVALQEVDNAYGSRSELEDQAQWLAARLGMDYCYAANLDLDPEEGRQERRQYGTAILSRHKLANCTNTLLPNHEGVEQRGLASAEINVRGVPVTVYNTHLTHTNSQFRALQFETINDVLADEENPAVLMGDLNARPDQPEYEVFTERLVDVCPVAGVGPAETLAPGNPTGRIDYILTTSDITARHAVVPQIESSDHFPVVATVELPHPSDLKR